MEFNLQRVRLLVVKDIMELILKSVAIIGLIFFVVTTFNLLIGAFSPNGNQISYDIFGSWLGICLVGCSIIGSIAWEEIKKRPSRIEYIALPASASEKTVSKVISVGIIFPVAMVVVYLLVLAYAQVFDSIIGDRLFLETNLDFAWSTYLLWGAIITSFFAYGSIKFNTGSFPKVILYGLLGMAILALTSFVFAFLLFPEFRALLFGNVEQVEHINMSAQPDDFWLVPVLKMIYYVVPIIFWALAYFTLKEKEA